MGLTEKHWFENEDVPENYEWALEDAVYNLRANKMEKDDEVKIPNMDIKEIITQLEKHYEAMCFVSCALAPDEESKRNIEAIKEASKLLKRFIPMELKQEGCGDYCPNCGISHTWSRDKFCANCGQAVKLNA